jgi:hypothetical protein
MRKDEALGNKKKATSQVFLAEQKNRQLLQLMPT